MNILLEELLDNNLSNIYELETITNSITDLCDELGIGISGYDITVADITDVQDVWYKLMEQFLETVIDDEYFTENTTIDNFELDYIDGITLVQDYLDDIEFDELRIKVADFEDLTDLIINK